MAPEFRYAGRDAEGKLLKGTITAADTAQVAELLRRRGLWVTDIRSAPPPARFLPQGKVSSRDLQWFCRQLAALVEAGVAPGHAIDILSRQTSHAALRRTLASVGAMLGEGTGLAAAFKAHPQVFSPLFGCMAKAAELSGQLVPAMERLGDHYERRHAFQSKVVAALTYPTLILTVTAAVLVILLVYILPSFHSMLMTLDAPMPNSTRVIFAVSLFLHNYFWFLLAVPTALVILAWWAFKGKARPRVDTLIIRIPVIGKVYRASLLGGMCRTLSGLTTGGVPILRALEVVAGMADNSILAPILDRARFQVADGARLADVFRRERLMPEIVPEMLAIGEETGALGLFLDRLADHFDQEADAGITTITSLLEPLLILGIGSLVGLILLSVLLPMFDVIWSIQ